MWLAQPNGDLLQSILKVEEGRTGRVKHCEASEEGFDERTLILIFFVDIDWDEFGVQPALARNRNDADGGGVGGVPGVYR